MIYVSLIESFVAAWACVRACRLHSMSIMGVIWFAVISYFIIHLKQNRAKEFKKKNKMIACVLAGILDVLYVIAERNVLTEGLNSRLFCAVILFVCLAGFFILLFYLLLFLLESVGACAKQQENGKKKHETILRLFPWITFFTCMTAWMPWYLYSYPGIMTPDSINQLEQVQHLIPYANHHPVIHTWTIGVFYKIGYALSGTANGGIGCYVLFQMMFMAFSAAFLVKTILRDHKDEAWVISLVAICFYAFIPYHAVMSVTVWKDAVFSAVVMLFSTILYRLSRDGAQNFKEILAYAVTAAAFCLFRSNGWYALLLMLPFLLFLFRKNKKIWYPLHFAVVGFVLVIKGPVIGYLGIGQPDFVESICIPVQQMARVLVDDRELTGEEQQLIEQVIDTTYIKELYAKSFADNMKELVRAGDPQYLEDNKAEYTRLYLHLMFRYPDEYFNALVDETFGYFDPNASYPVADAEGIIDNQCGVYWAPVIASKVTVKIREILLKLQTIVPVYGSLWSIGSVLWYSLILLGICLSRAEKISARLLAPFLPVFAVWVTVCIATPVAADFRYAYSMFFTLPLLAYIALEAIEERIERDGA